MGFSGGDGRLGEWVVAFDPGGDGRLGQTGANLAASEACDFRLDVH